ncbi:putative membrane protein [Xanthomonas campestris pv. campestris]|nr:putative membrane protein [Xanthomonas campestris pv. campestris]
MAVATPTSQLLHGWIHSVSRKRSGQAARDQPCLDSQELQHLPSAIALKPIGPGCRNKQANSAFYAEFTRPPHQVHSDFTQRRTRLRALAERFRRGHPDARSFLSAPSALCARCGSALSCWFVPAACKRGRYLACAALRTHGVIDMPAWLSLLCGVAVFVAAAYLLYVVLRPEDF